MSEVFLDTETTGLSFKEGHKIVEIACVETKDLIAISRSGAIALLDKQGRECERYKVPYGTTLIVKNDDTVKSGQTVAEWDPYTHPIISEVTGVADFVDMIEGVTVTRQTDDLTGLSTTVVLPDQANGKVPHNMDPRVL